VIDGERRLSQAAYHELGDGRVVLDDKCAHQTIIQGDKWGNRRRAEGEGQRAEGKGKGQGQRAESRGTLLR
jgi:hypothetical protein